MTNGGLTAQLDAVSYELFLYACQQFYSNSDNNYEYTKNNANDKPEALKSLYRSPGYKKNQLVLCKFYVLQW